MIIFLLVVNIDIIVVVVKIEVVVIVFENIVANNPIVQSAKNKNKMKK